MTTSQPPLGLPQPNRREGVGEQLLLVATVAVGGLFLWNGLVLASPSARAVSTT